METGLYNYFLLVFVVLDNCVKNCVISPYEATAQNQTLTSSILPLNSLHRQPEGVHPYTHSISLASSATASFCLFLGWPFNILLSIFPINIPYRVFIFNSHVMPAHCVNLSCIYLSTFGSLK